MRRIFALFLLLLATVSLGLTQHPDNAVNEGARLFVQSCSACHGNNAKGGRAADLTTGQRRHGGSDAELIRNITKGIPGTQMPAIPMSEVAACKIIAFLRSLSGGTKSDAITGHVEVGRRLFFGAAQCRWCHLFGGRSDILTSDLTDVRHRHRAPELVKRMQALMAFVTAQLAVGKAVRGINKHEDTFTLPAQPAARRPQPAVKPPAGSLPAVRDTCANFWTLAPDANGARQLLVLPAQAPTAWIAANIPGAESSAWREIVADEIGFVWLKQAARTVRFDPRKPQAGAREMAFAPSSVASQSQWNIVARMPASNHDLTAAVWHDKFYVAGGLTAEWGFPTRSHPFDELWELDTKRWQWRVAGKFGRGRIYCATAAFDEKIWIIGGDVIEADGTRHAVTTVQLYDPRTRQIMEGIPNTIARPMPLALVANGRLYVMGNERDKYDQPGQMESIGVGETVWRREPDGPVGMGPLAGATLNGKLYVAVRNAGLAIFDPATGTWELDATHKPRSCQMTAYRGEIWMLGGRDTAGEDQTLIYHPPTKAWRQGPRLPRPLSWGAAEVANGQLIVTGGAASYGRDYLYNDLTFVLREPSASRKK